MSEKLPPEVPGLHPLSLAADFCNDREDLFPLYPVFHHDLGVPDDIISLWSLAEDPVHDKLTVRPFIKHHIAAPWFPPGRFETDSVPGMAQKRGHAAAGDRHADFLSLLNQFPQDGDILPGIYGAYRHLPVRDS